MGGLVEDVDSDETSSDASDDKPVPDEPLVKLEVDTVEVDSSDSEEEANEHTFEFVKSEEPLSFGENTKAEVILKSALQEQQDNSSSSDEEDQEVSNEVSKEPFALDQKDEPELERLVEDQPVQEILESKDETDNVTESVAEPVTEPLIESALKEPVEKGDKPVDNLEEEDEVKAFENLDQVPAVTTLNALDYPEEVESANAEDSSAPSSLESQSGPSSVIIESQEVPTPDSASFILKTTEQTSFDNLPTPQEPVVEVIPGEKSFVLITLRDFRKVPFSDQFLVKLGDGKLKPNIFLFFRVFQLFCLLFKTKRNLLKGNF